MPDPQEQQSKDGEMSVDCMTDGQMKQRFGRHALHNFGAMFQHVFKIAEQARFLEVHGSAMMSTMSGAKRIYRKGQLHETVVLSALKSQLATTASGIGALDAFVQYFGGHAGGRRRRHPGGLPSRLLPWQRQGDQLDDVADLGGRARLQDNVWGLHVAEP